MFTARDHRLARATLAGVCAIFCALAAAGAADAHAFLIRATPSPGGEVGTPPAAVELFFTEPVRPVASGITVVRAGGVSVMAGKAYVPAANPREIVIPLRSGLGQGPYAVRWSEVDVEDGHLISGAFIFSIGGALPPIGSSASSTVTGGSPPLSAVISRWLELAGLLVAAGVAVFAVRTRRTWIVVAAALAVATLGAALSVALQSGESGTRFGHWTIIGACVAGVTAVLAAAATRVPALRLPTTVLAVVLVALPSATGHASAAGVPHWLSVPADVLHLAAAAVWVGGVVALALVVPRDERRAAGRRFTPYAVGAVALLGASGIVRAYNELDSVHQVWSTGYGQALLVKTGVLAAVLVLGWLNRSRLATLGLGAEIGLLAVVIGAVAVLVNVRPGIDRAGAIVAPAPTSNTVVFAGEAGSLAVGLAATPDGDSMELKATVLGQNGPRDGLHVRLAADAHDASATPCGVGCYRAIVPVATPKMLTATVEGTTLRFDAPSSWPAPQALDIVRNAEQEIRSLKTLVVHSHLASDATHAVTTIYKEVAPDRLAYHNVGGGDSIIIGNKRWDRQPGQRWVQSSQYPPINQPSPFWPEQITDAHILRTTPKLWVVSFLDPGTPAWFTAWIERSTYRTVRLHMVAAAHFMHDVDGPFNEPVSVTPPGR